MILSVYELNRLRVMQGYERRRAGCSCGHVAYYHKIDSGKGECFVVDCLCDGFVFLSRAVA